jgi:hypothetical protein
MKTKEQKLLEHDDALLKRERSIRFTRAAATCFAALMFFGVIMHSVHASKFASTDLDATSVFVVSTDAGNIDLKIPAFLMCAFFFWAALAHEYNLRSKHIDSIKMYRSKLKEQEGTKTSQPSPGTYSSKAADGLTGNVQE